MMLGLFPILQKYKRHIAVLTSGLLALSVIAATQVRLSNDLMDYFPHDAPIRLQAETIQNQLGGMRRLDIVLDGQIEGTFLKLRYLEEIEKLQDHLRQTGLFEKSISFVDYLKLVHQVMDEIEGEQLYLPEDDAIVQEYANFIEHRHIESYVSEDFSGARIVILHAIDASRELGQAVEELRRYIEQYIDPDLEVRVTGESVLSNEATSYITWGQGKSLTVMLVIIVLIVTALFTKLTAGLIAIVPNLIPVTVLFGVMGLWGIPLNTGTAMIAAIAIGIAVDDTIHFMTRYNQQLHLSSTRLQALCNTMEEEAHPIILTSIALALGFATLGFSDFPPVRHFGLLSALVILVALIANFVITPLLLSHVRLVTVWDLLAVRLKSHIVDRCPLFKDMSLWEVRKTVLLSRCVRHAAGSAIFEQGEAGQEMYVILDGQIEMRHRNDAGEICVLDTLRPGQVFGVTALAAEVPRPVTMVATKNSELLALRWEGLRRIGHLFPYLSTKLYRNVSTIIGKRLAAELEHIDNCENPCGKSGSEPNDGMPIDRQTMINI